MMDNTNLWPQILEKCSRRGNGRKHKNVKLRNVIEHRLLKNVLRREREREKKKRDGQHRTSDDESREYLSEVPVRLRQCYGEISGRTVSEHSQWGGDNFWGLKVNHCDITNFSLTGRRNAMAVTKTTDSGSIVFLRICEVVSFPSPVLFYHSKYRGPMNVSNFPSKPVKTGEGMLETGDLRRFKDWISYQISASES